MAGKSQSASRNTANQTGKSGNASGSKPREARGENHGRSRRGKSSAGKLSTSPRSKATRG